MGPPSPPKKKKKWRSKYIKKRKNKQQQIKPIATQKTAARHHFLFWDLLHPCYSCKLSEGPRVSRLTRSRTAFSFRALLSKPMRLFVNALQMKTDQRRCFYPTLAPLRRVRLPHPSRSPEESHGKERFARLEPGLSSTAVRAGWDPTQLCCLGSCCEWIKNGHS